MLNYHGFSLENYTLKTKQQFYYYDVLIKNTNTLKKDFFKKTGIPASSYIKAKTIEQQIGKQLTHKLANYFNILPLDLKEVEKYEKLISQVFTKINFKIPHDFTIDLETLEDLCQHESILKPIFKLFICLIKVLDVTVDPNVIEHAREEYEYIKEYREYFIPEYKILFFILEILFERKIFKYMKEYLEVLKESNFAHGLFYYILSIKSFHDNEYYDAIIYGRKSEECFIAENNQNRLFKIRNNMAACYNRLGRYAESIEICEANLLAANIFHKDSNVYEDMKSQYFHALILSDKCEEVIKLMSLLETLDETDYYYLAISCLKLNRKNEFMMIYNQYITKLTQKDSYEFKILTYIVNNVHKNRCKVPTNLSENLDVVNKRIISDL